MMYLDEIGFSQNNDKPYCIWLRGHFNGLATSSPSRKLNKTKKYAKLSNSVIVENRFFISDKGSECQGI
ncbi:MAG: hypothetical protein RR370_04285 [Synergistaceae bacterium]